MGKKYGKVWLLLAFVFAAVLSGCGWGDDETSVDTHLNENVWADGKFSKDGQSDTYYISVTKGVRYFIYMNNASQGDGKKTAKTGLVAYHSDGTKICDDYNDAYELYASPYTFTASSTGTVTITVIASNGSWWGGGTGTYAIKYASRPEYDALSEGIWKDDSIISSGQTNMYTISVTKGTRYFIYMNNASQGDGKKTARTGLVAWHSDGSKGVDDYNKAYELYTNPYTFIAINTGTVTVRVAASNGSWWGSGTGTYAIKYTSRPEYDVLSEGIWKDDSIISSGQTNKYSISVTKGTQYFIYMNNAYQGNGKKSAKTGFVAYHSDGTKICDDYNKSYELYTNPYAFTASSTGTVTITVVASTGSWWGGGTGTYAIKYAIGSVQ